MRLFLFYLSQVKEQLSGVVVEEDRIQLCSDKKRMLSGIAQYISARNNAVAVTKLTEHNQTLAMPQR